MADNVKNFKKEGVQVAVWTNKGQYGQYATVDIKRTYKDKEGNFKDTHTLRPSNLLALEALMPDVKKHILLVDPKAFDKREKE